MSPEIEPDSDPQLIRAYLRGNEHAFERLYGRYRNRLLSYLNRLVQPDYSAADDLFQQVWLRVIRNLSAYTDREKFISWLFRIAHNLAIDYLRTKNRQLTTSFEDQEPILTDETDDFRFSTDESDLTQSLSKAILTLSPEQQEVVRLRQEGVSFKEIAVIQSVPLNTAIGRMHDALRNIRHFLTRTQPGAAL